MGIFSRFEFGKNKEKNKEKNNSGASEWDKISEEVPFRQVEEDRLKAETERQQRKIIASMMYSMDYLDEDDVILPEGAEETFLKKLNSGEINENDERKLLDEVGGPVEEIGFQGVNGRLSGNKHLRRILGFAVAGKYGFDHYDEVTTGLDAIRKFEHIFPTPMDFEHLSQDILEGVRGGSGEQKYRQYVEDMEKFQRAVYGKKYEYYKSLKGLEEKAAEAAQLETYTIEKYTDAERAEVVKKSLIDGDDFYFNGSYYRLTPEILDSVDLAPKEKMTLEGREIGLSGSFKVGSRDCIMGYVKTDDGYKVRGYYRSNSQGVWRYLPDYVTDWGKHDGIGWYGKGYSEEMMTLPCEMQKELSKIATEGPLPVGQKMMPSFVLAGTAKMYESKDEYRQAIRDRSLRGDLYQEVDEVPEADFGELTLVRTPPEQLDVRGFNVPNFKKRMMSWNSNAGLYGRLKNLVYESFNEKLRYVFSEDDRGRCFISNIEVGDSPITSTGVKAKWVRGGDIEMPLYEYGSQTGGYGDPQDKRGSYECMWKNYLSKMKIIQEFLRMKK